MGTVTVDDRNPGRRQVQGYSVGAGLDGNKGDHAAQTQPIKFLMLKNCLVDKRLAAVLKRPGSTTETIASSLGVPLGIGEYTEASTGPMPINRTLLANFGGGTFYKNTSGTWSSVSKTAYCSFSSSRQSQFAKLGSNLFIAGGLPAKWGGGSKSIDRVGIVPPTTAAEIVSYNTGTGVTLRSGTRYMYTFYDSQTGLESDWSPLSEEVPGPIADKSIILYITRTGFVPTNWDRIKIYRTLDGGSRPYLITVLPNNVTLFTDNVADEALIEAAEDVYERLPPPETSYICAKYAQCMWYVDATDPYKLVFSKPFVGQDYDLEYFPRDNYVMSNEPITALFSAPGKLLVFHPRGISYVSGFSTDDFAFQPFVPGVGTVFPNSISTNGTDIVFLSEGGFVTLQNQGGRPRPISREIDLELQPLLVGSYNNSLYVSSAWNPSLRQFIFMVSAEATVGAPWEEVGTGNTSSAIAGWEDSVALTTDTWEDPARPNISATLRVKVWGWSPELSDQGGDLWMEYTFPTITDDNVNGAYPLFVFHPQPSSDTMDPQQDKTYMGYWSGSEGKIRSCFRRDKNQDDSTDITSELITERLAPGIPGGGFKFFDAIGFQGSYSDPTSSGTATLKYLKDFDDPHLRSYAGSLVTISGSSDIKKFTQNLGRHIHLYLTDTSQSQSKILLSQFFIHYRERMARGGR